MGLGLHGGFARGRCVARGALHEGCAIWGGVHGGAWRLCTRTVCCTSGLARGAMHEGHVTGGGFAQRLCTRVRLSTRRPRCTRGVARGGRLPLHNGHRTEALHGRFAWGLCTRAARCTTALHGGTLHGGPPHGALHEDFARGPLLRTALGSCTEALCTGTFCTRTL